MSVTKSLKNITTKPRLVTQSVKETLSIIMASVYVTNSTKNISKKLRLVNQSVRAILITTNLIKCVFVTNSRNFMIMKQKLVNHYVNSMKKLKFKMEKESVKTNVTDINNMSTVNVLMNVKDGNSTIMKQ